MPYRSHPRTVELITFTRVPRVLAELEYDYINV